MRQPAVAAPAIWPGALRVGFACAGALLLVSACGPVVAHMRSGRVVSPAHPPAGIVPWVDRPAPAYMPPAPPSPASPPAKYAPCTAADLAGRLGGFGLGMGHYTRYLVLTNVSRHACTLAGGPSTITGFRADRSQVKLAGAAGEGPDANLIGPANLRPGQSAQVALTTASMCAFSFSCSRDAYTAVAVGIGGSGEVRVGFPSGQPFYVIRARAAIGVSAFGVPVPPPPPTSSPLDVLTVTIAMPGTLTAGTTASYTVTLHNPASHAVALRPCPSYAEFVWPAGGTAWSALSDVHRYYLNCQAVSEITADSSVTFGMRVPVPATSGRARQAKYGWILQGTTVATGGVVTVTAGATP